MKKYLFLIPLFLCTLAWAGYKVTGNLQVTGLSGSGDRCVKTDSSGNVIAASADCGTGSGSINWSDPTNITPINNNSGWTASTGKVVLTTSTDNVGIGTTVPIGKTQISSTNATATGVNFQVDNSIYSSNFTVLNNGYIGIGTTTPANGLEVGSPVTGQNQLINGTEGTVVTPSFVVATNWTLGTAWEATNDGGTQLNKNASFTTAASYLKSDPTNNINYKIVFTMNATVVGGVIVSYGEQSTGVINPAINTPTTYTFYHKCGSTLQNLYFNPQNGASRFTITNITITPLTAGTGNLTILGDTYLAGRIMNVNGTIGVQVNPNGTLVAGGTVTSPTITSTGTMAFATTLTGMRTTTGTTYVGGLILSSPSATASITSQNSPIVQFKSQGWNTGGTPATKENTFDIAAVSVGTANPTSGRLVIKNTTVDGVADATELMSIQGSGKVGIGTSTPQSKLDVYGSVAIGTTYAGVTAAPTNGLIVQGNVGIGSATPATALDVNGVITATSGTSTNWNTAYTDRLKWDGGASDLVAATGRSSLGIGSIYPLNAGTMTDTKYCTYASGTTAIVCNSDAGGVAVSSANPSATIALTAVNGSANTFMRSDGAPALGVGISPTWTGNHTFTPASGNTVISAGNLGIGTATPVATLDTVGAGTTSATSNVILRNSAKTALVTVLNDGNVGLNTTVPGYKLEVDGTLYGQGLYDTGNLVGMVKIATASPSAAANFTINGLATNGKYRLIATLLQSATPGDARITFNGDTTATRYRYYSFYKDAAKTSASSGFITISEGLNVGASTLFSFVCDISASSASTTTSLICSAGWNAIAVFTWGEYNYTNAITSITFTAAAGAVTGTAELYKLQ